MKKQTPYLTQYYNLKLELKRNKINYDELNEDEYQEIISLKNKAIEESGLTDNELGLILLCRKHNIFRKVNVYANKIKF